MPGRVTRTDQAEQDLLEIWAYVAADNPRAADRLLDRIDAAARVLADFPRLGPARDDIAPGFRYHVVGNYLIFYREAEGGIEIVRVVHGARRLSDLL